MGQLKLKACRICEDEFEPFRTTQKVCSPKCALEFNRRQAAAKKAKEQRKEA